MSVTLEEARRQVAVANAEGNKPRIHPNGFIQLDLEPGHSEWAKTSKGHSGAARRLHIWNPPGIDLPRQETVNEIHDHVFDMKSTIVKGKLQQRLYWFVVGSPFTTHEMYRAVYDQASSSRLAPMGIQGSLRPVETFDVEEGDQYTQPAFTFHDTYVPPGTCVITVMEKEEVHDGEATVICPLGDPPDNTFDRATAASQELLWSAIQRSFDA